MSKITSLQGNEVHSVFCAIRSAAETSNSLEKRLVYLRQAMYTAAYECRCAC